MRAAGVFFHSHTDSGRAFSPHGPSGEARSIPEPPVAAGIAVRSLLRHLVLAEGADTADAGRLAERQPERRSGPHVHAVTLLLSELPGYGARTPVHLAVERFQPRQAHPHDHGLHQLPLRRNPPLARIVAPFGVTAAESDGLRGGHLPRSVLAGDLKPVGQPVVPGIVARKSVVRDDDPATLHPGAATVTPGPGRRRAEQPCGDCGGKNEM